MRFRSLTFSSLLALAIAVTQPASAQVELTGTHLLYVNTDVDGSLMCSSSGCSSRRSIQYVENVGGTPTCDFFSPGTAVERFTLEATPAGSSSIRLHSGSPLSSDDFGTSPPVVDGRTITWTGSATLGPTSVRIDQIVEVGENDRFIRMTVTVTNTGSVALNDVYYLRNADPDHGSCSIGSATATFNDVRRQPPGDDSALATARGGSSGNEIVWGLGSHDRRARAHTGGFENSNASGEWNSPNDQEGTSHDDAIDLVFKEPTLAPGASTTFELLYVFGTSEAEVEARFDELGFPTAPCEGLAEGDACTTEDSLTGVCRDGRCCTGCWDGTRCRLGTSTAACGLGGGACAECNDGDACTSDVCSEGVCSYPNAPVGTPCNDGFFCTARDTCDGAGTCVGSGSRCDDHEDCTVDSCNEETDTCENVARPNGESCVGGPFAAAGVCHAAHCCTGCFDGSVCHVGTTAAACGVGGGPCTSCVDGDPCSTDVCLRGVCSNPPARAGTPCDDGLFCTSTDVCDGSGACVGGGPARCNDNAACTTDFCDEENDVCVYTPTGAGCAIGGACLEAGAVNPTYPCLVCDPARSLTEWSLRAAGEVCGSPRCGAGRLTTYACDATGTCEATTTRCATGVCAGPSYCAEGCVPGGCPSGTYCDVTVSECLPQRAAGEACSDSAECATGWCVDGVCCNNACDDTCERCNDPEWMGVCRLIPAGTDPDNECGEGRACNGSGRCRMIVDAGMPDAGQGRQDAGTHDDAEVLRLDAGIDAGDAVQSSGGCSAAGNPNRSPLGLALMALLAAALVVRRRMRG